jgi:hypothetical protein
MEKYYLNQQPWANYKEWKTCFDYLFNNKYGDRTGAKINKLADNLDSFINELNIDDLLIAKKIIRIWTNRGDNMSLILTTSLLLDEVIKIKDGVCEAHILAQKIIRVTNLIIDNYRKKNKGSGNMFLVAKELSFPEFIIEVRHSCTHKDLPDTNILIYTIKYLYSWIKHNLWDRQYKLFEDENNLYNKLCDVILNMKNVNSILSDIENIDSEIKLEIDKLIRVCNLFTKSFIDSSKVDAVKNKKTIITKNVNEFQRIYKTLFNIEGDLVLLVIFKYISDNIMDFVSLSLNEEKKILDEKSDYLHIVSYFLNILIKLSPLSKNLELNELIENIYRKLYFCRDFSQSITKINEIYVQYYKNLIEEIPKVTNDFKSNINENEKYSKIGPGTLIFAQLENLQNAESIKKMVQKIKQVEKPKNEKDTDYTQIIDIESTLIL